MKVFLTLLLTFSAINNSIAQKGSDTPAIQIMHDGVKLWEGPVWPQSLFFGHGISGKAKYFLGVSKETRELLLVKLLTGNSIVVASNKAGIYTTAISPDERYIAFNASTDTLSALCILDVHTKNAQPKVVHSSSQYSIHPYSWSADGKRIAVSLYGRGEKAFRVLVAVFHVNTEKLTIVTEATKGKKLYNISFSPDGRSIAFDDTKESIIGQRDIYVVGADGKGKAVLVGE
jgi:Tol biopolymer transport system component